MRARVPRARTREISHSVHRCGVILRDFSPEVSDVHDDTAGKTRIRARENLRCDQDDALL